MAEGRDETTLARALYSTPLRVDSASGAVVPGLCRGWSSSDGFRRWKFTCRSAPAIAAAIRRVAHLPDAPANWIFSRVQGISVDADTLSVRLSIPWRRFPYALTVAGAAPRTAPGPFELVSGSKRRIVARREGLTVEFQRVTPRDAVRAFRRGELDEAPIPVGDVAAASADSELGTAIRADTLLGLDVVVFNPIGYGLQRAYRDAAARGDYEQLIPEATGAAAYGFSGGERAKPARFRRALAAIRTLPRKEVRIAVPPDPALRSGARILYSDWRNVGLGPVLVSDARSKPDATFVRLRASYPQQEAIPAELVLGYGLQPRGALLRALAATGQRDDLNRVEGALWRSARAVPVAWVRDARLVSPRLRGWHEDVLGNVDYAEVRSLASSR